MEDGDDVCPGEDDAEFEGELCGVAIGEQLAVLRGGLSFVPKQVAPLLLHAGNLVVNASELDSDFG